MARLAAYNDTTMPIADTMAEMWAATATHHVIGGCTVTLDATDLTYDVAAGAVKVSGVNVTVAAQTNAGTLAADSSLPRWTWICLDNTGVDVMVSGTAAATPSIPELGGDYVPLMLVYVAAGATLASAQTNYVQSIPWDSQTWQCSATLTSNADVALSDVTGLKFFVGASETWAFEAHLQLSTGATPDIKMAFTLPAAAASTGNYSYQTGSGVLNARVADWTAAQSMATAAAGVGAILSGRVVNSVTAGWVQLQAAQDTSDASNTDVIVGSWIRATRVV